MNSLIIGQYVPKESIIHQLDSRLKISIVFIYVIILFAAETSLNYLLFFILSILCMSLTQIKLSFIIKGLKPVWFLIVITFVLHIILTREGDIWFDIFGFPVYKEAIIKGFEIALRFFLLILMTTLLTLTTSPIAITDAVEELLSPLKKVNVPVHELALTMSISLRFIPTLIQEVDKISKAQASRGLDFRTGKMKDRVQAIIPLILPLFISAFKRAEELAFAMEARGYRGGEGRTKYRELRFKNADYIAGLSFILFLVGFIITR
ncbi:energy-coupling factor transporter transmembrane protein EcfT [Filobacillus milosensis]|uniref:Energy-coupling factor transporter transmembrane protein EcfT n=1 Tax=Filobacillus milosensis TaxID=94137 RepID=A0A4Y8IGX2_9BACI|nr:energy-coupling factor transporter transmembrane component T [Filobacillus milosensis]TFB14697.1 energy-coupling factor transporter transmembrane protein EcfT [Filobacillus milosensis]